MMKKIKSLVLAFLAVAAIAARATTGDSEARAAKISAGATRDVVLVPEYDPESKTYDYNSGVYYFKAELKRSMGYTVVTSNIATNTIELTCYAAEPKEDGKFGPSADFTEYDEPGYNQRMVMFASDWYIDDEDDSESDPKSWDFYFVVTGSVGDRATVTFSLGSIIPSGREENPLTFASSTTPATMNRTLQLNNEFFLRTRLTAGKLYSYGTVGGTETIRYTLDIAAEDPETDKEDDDPSDLEVYDDPAWAAKPYDTGILVIPSRTDYYIITVRAESEDEIPDYYPFGLTHRLYPSRAITAHPAASIGTDGKPVVVSPGRVSAAGSAFFDEIIDESLFKFTTVKGRRYAAETSAAATNLLMRVYDAKGTIVAENRGRTLKSFDTLCAFESVAGGDYYVGVCQDLDDTFSGIPAYLPVTLSVSSAEPVAGSPDAADPDDDAVGGASPVSPVAATADASPRDVDPDGTEGWHSLGRTDWQDVFMIAGRKGVTYALTVSVKDAEAVDNELEAEVFYLMGSAERVVETKGDINPGMRFPLSFDSTLNTTYYIRVKTAGGVGLDYTDYKLHAMAYSTTGAEGALGSLQVNTLGAAGGTWSIDSESVKYPGGASVLLAGTHTVKFSPIAGFSVPAARTVTVAPGAAPTVIDAYYSDTFDPKDDTQAGATAWALKNVPTSMSRTLWKSDVRDTFAIAGKDGQYFDFTLGKVTGDAVFTISHAQYGVLAKDVTSVSKLPLPTSTGKYYLTVTHKTPSSPKDGGYELSGFFTNVGALKLAKTAISAKENAPSVALTVNRTAKDGVVKVAYGTVAGTALPGIDYVAQSGVLEWAANDNKPKTITVRLIPDLVPVYEGNKQFSIQLKPVEELGADEYPASFVGGSTCVVTLTEVSRPGTTVASSYAAKAPMPATVATEKVSLTTGAFTGLLVEEGGKLTNGLPRLASVAFTASTTTPAALSAKVQLAGKTYTFAAKGWDDSDATGAGKVFELVQKVNNVTYTNTLTLSVAEGASQDASAWLKAGGTAELVMNVPDANGKGVQRDIRYTGELFRNNAKIQSYLTAVTNFTGYYTIALKPTGVSLADGIPAGNGYLTLTVDNKGTAKVAGMLADGATKPSLSVAACAVRPDAESSNGYALWVPVYFGKAPVCFGGLLRLYRDKTGSVVVDSASPLAWYNDNPAVTYGNTSGYAIDLKPVGGFYDTVLCLQAYYKDYALEVGTEPITSFPKEALLSGYSYATAAQPNGTAVDVLADAFATEKKVVVKNGTLVDLAASSNPCNVQVKLARPTGLVSGSFSVWTEGTVGGKPVQKEVSGLKHNGVVVLAHDGSESDDAASYGFFTQPVKLSDYNPVTKRTTTRNWTFSAPFNVRAVELPETDPWAEDWGVAK